MRSLYLCVVLAGCVVEDASTPGRPVAVAAANKLALNKLALNKLALNKLALNKLAVGALSSTTLVASDAIAAFEAETADPGDAAGHSTVLEYVVRCALPDGQALEVPRWPADPHSYAGGIGVGGSWLAGGACDEDCQEWVSACLLAHVNGLGVSVAISLRGDHPALAPTIDELAHYTDQEAAFYGNLFIDQDPGTGTIDHAFACTGWALQRDAALAHQPNGPAWIANAHLAERICGRRDGGADACPGIRVVAPCGNYLLWGGAGATACDRLTGINPSGPAAGSGVYWDDCYPVGGTLGLRGLGGDPPPVHHRIITTFLDTRGFGYGTAP
jgi:hypothetical protein